VTPPRSHSFSARPVPKSASESPATTARTLDPQDEVVVLAACVRLDSDHEPVTGHVPVGLAGAAAKPLQVRAAVTGLLGGDGVLVDQVLRGVRRRGENGGPEALDQRLRVALVPRRGEDDHRLAFAREREQRYRHGERVKEQQALAVIDRIRRHLLRPPLARRPVRVRRPPVPKSGLKLAHSAMLMRTTMSLGGCAWA
jgi:hypothetical protein